MMDKRIINIIMDIEVFYSDLYINTKGKISYSLKENGTSVSKFDLDATKYCIDTITYNFPNANIWIEENQIILKDDANQYTWIIDPLDGTASFLRGYPVWGIGIAVMMNGLPFLSYFFAPDCNQKYLSYDNKIFINNEFFDTENNILNNDTKTLFVSSRLHKKIGYKQFEDYKVRNFGSTLYHLFMVVLGKAESCIISSCYIWDIAAVFYLADMKNYRFYNFESKKSVSILDFLDFKNQKIDIILEFKKVSDE